MTLQQNGPERRLGHFTRSTAIAIALLGCSVYDDELARPNDAGSSGTGGSAADVGSRDAARDRTDDDASGSFDGPSERDASEGGSGRGGAGGAGGATTVDAAPDTTSLDARSDADASDGDAQVGVDRVDSQSDAHVDGSSADASDALADASDGAGDGGPVVGILYNIIAKHSGKCMTLLGNVPVDGAEIVQWRCDGSDSQRFRLQVSGSSFTIVNDRWNSCATVDTSDAETANHLVIGKCVGSAGQAYDMMPASVAGFHTLTQPQSGKCVSVDSASTLDLTNILAAPCSGGTHQAWQFVVAPTD